MQAPVVLSTMQFAYENVYGYAEIISYLEKCNKAKTATAKDFDYKVSRISWEDKMSVTVLHLPAVSVIVSANDAIAEQYTADLKEARGFYFDDGDVYECAVESQADVDFVLAELKRLVELI